MSSSTTSAMRRSRSVLDARSTAAAAAFSQESVLVPTSSITLYTLSAMALLLPNYTAPSSGLWGSLRGHSSGLAADAGTDARAVILSRKVAKGDRERRICQPVL